MRWLRDAPAAMSCLRGIATGPSYSDCAEQVIWDRRLRAGLAAANCLWTLCTDALLCSRAAPGCTPVS